MSTNGVCYGNGVTHFSGNGVLAKNGGLEVSVVVPIYNERENVSLLHQRVQETLDALGRTWELVLVDDGSTDGSFEVMKQICLKDWRVRVVRLRRNFGQTPALSAGFNHARGAVIVTMDGDLQNDPTDIPRLLAKLEEGYDIVSGWRKDRKDPFISKRLPSLGANRLAQWMTGVHLHDFGCTLKAYRREVLERVHLYGELHRFIPAVASSDGACIAELEVRHHPRRFGKTKYGVMRMMRGILDLLALKLLLGYMTRPMQVFGGIGLFLMGIALLSGLATLAMKVFLGFDMTGNPLLYLSMLGIIASIQLISLGFLGEINARTYYESTQKSTYVVHEIVGYDEPTPTLAGAVGR
jgi:glycosyltransferase involved in cell wall biosynthesis